MTQPQPNTTWVDDTGRTLHVTEVNPDDRLDRHVVGTINGQPYSCSFVTWDVIWRPRQVVQEPIREDEERVTELYRGGEAVQRKPGWAG